MTRQAQNFQENKNASYLDARADYFRILAERLYSAILGSDFFFKFSKLFKEMGHDLDIIRKYTKKIVDGQESNKNNGNTKLYLVDVLFANNVEGEALNDQINTFILAVSMYCKKTTFFIFH